MRTFSVIVKYDKTAWAFAFVGLFFSLAHPLVPFARVGPYPIFLFVGLTALCVALVAASVHYRPFLKYYTQRTKSKSDLFSPSSKPCSDIIEASSELTYSSSRFASYLYSLGFFYALFLYGAYVFFPDFVSSYLAWASPVTEAARTLLPVIPQIVDYFANRGHILLANTLAQALAAQLMLAIVVGLLMVTRHARMRSAVSVAVDRIHNAEGLEQAAAVAFISFEIIFSLGTVVFGIGFCIAGGILLEYDLGMGSHIQNIFFLFVAVALINLFVRNVLVLIFLSGLFRTKP